MKIAKLHTKLHKSTCRVPTYNITYKRHQYCSTWRLIKNPRVRLQIYWYDGITWKDDPIERARRIWEWWRAKRCTELHHFTWAARLVVLVQISSASVERIFSQVKLIVETTGVNPLEETLPTRLMEHCNVYSIV